MKKFNKCIAALEKVNLGTIRISNGGTPHILFEKKNRVYSVAYFINVGNYRVFWPYLSSDQKRKDFKKPEEVQTFLETV